MTYARNISCSRCLLPYINILITKLPCVHTLAHQLSFVRPRYATCQHAHDPALRLALLSRSPNDHTWRVTCLSQALPIRTHNTIIPCRNRDSCLGVPPLVHGMKSWGGVPPGMNFIRFFFFFGKIKIFWEKSIYFWKNQNILRKVKIFWENPFLLGKNKIFWENVKIFWENQFILGKIKIFREKSIYFRTNQNILGKTTIF